MPTKKVPARSKRSGQKRGHQTRPLYAAVDLGTNNCRLLIAQPRGKTFHVVASYAQTIRLGEGLHESGKISESAIERAIEALRAIRQKLKAHKVGRVRCIATEACRKASNGEQFIARIHKETGLTFKIIAPKEEASLALIGCHDLIDRDAASVLVVDIGGGSTELSWVDAKAARANGFKGLLARAPIRDWTSLPLGVVTLSEAFQHLPEEEAFAAMLAHAKQVIGEWDGLPHIRERFADDRAHMIGTSGTVTCLAGVHLKLDRYRRDRVDGAWLSREESAAAVNVLKSAGLDGRALMPAIGAERAGLMMSGCAIIEAAWELFPAQRLRVADRGLREGLLLTMMYGPKKVRNRRGRAKHRRRKRHIQNAGAQSTARIHAGDGDAR